MFLETINDNYLWVLVGILLLNMSQRRLPDSDRKRRSCIWLLLLCMFFQLSVLFILHKQLNHHLAWISAALCVLFGFIFRKHVWPFRLHCVRCGRRLDWEHIVGHDDNLCQDCWDKGHPEEAAARKRKEEAKKPGYKPPFVMPKSVDDMDWDNWDPTDICVITYLIDGERVLLIDKKRGLGTGYINAPGGHVEEAETAREAAVREFKEETGLDIDPSSLEQKGELFFQFKDGMAEHAYVYIAHGWKGELKECDETRPFWWENRHELPFDRMWQDDTLWVPQVMEGKTIKGYFLFDGKTMTDSKVEVSGGDE